MCKGEQNSRTGALPQCKHQISGVGRLFKSSWRTHGWRAAVKLQLDVVDDAHTIGRETGLDIGR